MTVGEPTLSTRRLMENQMITFTPAWTFSKIFSSHWHNPRLSCPMEGACSRHPLENLLNYKRRRGTRRCNWYRRSFCDQCKKEYGSQTMTSTSHRWNRTRKWESQSSASPTSLASSVQFLYLRLCFELFISSSFLFKSLCVCKKSFSRNLLYFGWKSRKTYRCKLIFSYLLGEQKE